MDHNKSKEMKRGYLLNDFEFFHLKDMKDIQFEYHYHDFSKIIVFISGSVTYLIEGTAYRLKPWDVLFVSSNEIHKPIIDPSVPYERIAIWVNPCFLEIHSGKGSELQTCFRLVSERKENLLRLDNSVLKHIRSTLLRLEEACRSSEFASAIMKNSIFLQLLILLTRELLGSRSVGEPGDIVSDENIQKIMNFINMNLSGNLSIDALAEAFYLNRYHIMHKFKQQTGFSVHSYILQKRLIKADSLIRDGMPAAQASEMSGFNDYSSFIRSYKKMFGTSPKQRACKS